MKSFSSIPDRKDDDNDEHYSNGHKVIFKHELGGNWSLYHNTILESICHNILSMPIKVEIKDSSFVIYIK